MNKARLDCKYAKEYGSKIGSQEQQFKHYQCTKKNIALTEPMFNSLIKIPYTKGSIIGYEEHMYVSGFFRKKIVVQKVPVYEQVHPCEDCWMYEKQEEEV